MTPAEGVARAFADLLCRVAGRDKKAVIRFLRRADVQDHEDLIRLVTHVARPAVPPDAADAEALADKAARMALSAAGMLPEPPSVDAAPADVRWPGDPEELAVQRPGRPSLVERLGRNPYPDRIRAYCLAGGSREELARACGVHLGTVHAWAQGVYAPGPRNAAKLDRVLARRGV